MLTFHAYQYATSHTKAGLLQLKRSFNLWCNSNELDSGDEFVYKFGTGDEDNYVTTPYQQQEELLEAINECDS